jgi:hypothetical protein
MCLVTLSEVDLTDGAEVERAILALESLHRVSLPGAVDGEVHLSFAADDVLLLRRSLADADPTLMVWRDGAWTLGKRTRALLAAMETLIRRDGPATVRQVAAFHGVSRQEARTCLRNAFQAARAYAVSLPLQRTWDSSIAGFRYDLA